MKREYTCFRCGEEMNKIIGGGLICSNTNCGRFWFPNGRSTSSKDEKQDYSDNFVSSDFDETDGYEDEMGYYNINGHMPPSGWGKKRR